MAIPTGAIRASTKFLAHAHDQGAKHQRKVPHVKILPSKVKVRERKERERERERERARAERGISSRLSPSFHDDFYGHNNFSTNITLFDD